MHSFIELVDRSTRFSLATLKEKEEAVVASLQMSAASHLVKTLQMFRLQRAILSVGMFSIFDAIIQDRLKCPNGFEMARQSLKDVGEETLLSRFSHFSDAVNVLKHGQGRSYDRLLKNIDSLPFSVKKPDEGFFYEGDVAEVSTLIEVDDEFVQNCADVISLVAVAIEKHHQCQL